MTYAYDVIQYLIMYIMGVHPLSLSVGVVWRWDCIMRIQLHAQIHKEQKAAGNQADQSNSNQCTEHNTNGQLKIKLPHYILTYTTV